MADNATTNQTVQNSAPPSGGGANVLYVGDEKEFAGHKVLIKRLLVKNRQFIPKNDIPIGSGEKIVLEGRGLGLYDRAGFTLTDGGSSFDTVLKSSGNEDGFFSFEMPDIAGQVKDGGRFWLKLLSKTFPAINATLEPHAVYFLEQPEDKKDAKTPGEEREGRAAAARGSQGGPTDLVMGAMGDVLGGIAGALKSTNSALSAGAKTISQSGTATSPAAGKSASVETSGGGSNQVEGYQEEIVSQPITSTSEVSTGGQTIRESGTVSAGGQVRTEGNTGATRTISTEGTVQTAGSAGARTKVSSTVQGETGVAGGGSSQTTVSGQTSVGGNVSGTADIRSQVESGARAKTETTVTGQSSTAAPGSAGASGGAAEKVKEEANLTGKAKEKTEVQADQTVENKEQTQNQAPAAASAAPALTATPTAAPASAPAPSMAKSLEDTQTLLSRGLGGATSGTAGMGGGLSAFGGGTMPSPPAGLDRIKANNDELASLTGNLNISTGGTVISSAVSKPAQGGAGASGASDGKKETADAKAGEPPKKSDQTEPKESPASPKGKQDKGLPMREPGDAKEPDKEAKPPSEAPPGPAKPAEKDDTAVPPPIGDRRAPVGSGGQGKSPQTGQQPSAINKGKPIDGADRGLNKDLQPPVASAQPNEGTDAGQVEKPGDVTGAGGPQPVGGSNTSPVAGNGQPKAAAEPAKKAGAGATGVPGGSAGAGAAVGALAGSKAGQELIKKTSGKLWYYAFASSCATFFTGLDFFAGAIGMDVYWIFGHRKNPEMFPLKGWQKAVTIAANIIPPILIVLILALILVAGCNWPAPIRTSAGNKYTFTVVGAFIGDSCKYFDVSNITSSGSNAASNTPAASSQTTSQTTSGAVTPR